MVTHFVKLIVAAPLSSARAIEVANSSVAAIAASVSLLMICIIFVLLYLFVQARSGLVVDRPEMSRHLGMAESAVQLRQEF